MGDSTVIDDGSEDSKTRPLPRELESPKSGAPKSGPPKSAPKKTTAGGGDVEPSRPFQVVSTLVPPSRGAPDSQTSEPSQRAVLGQGNPGTRRTSSIRPAPASFKPTLRDSSNLPPPMVVHSGDLDENAKVWGAPDVVNHPSQVNVEKPLPSEPFGFAEDLRQKTIPLDFSKVDPDKVDALIASGNLPSESDESESAQPSAADENIESPPDSSDIITQTRNERPEADAESSAKAASNGSAPDILRAEVASSQGSSKSSKSALPWLAAAGALGLCVAVFAFGRGTPAAHQPAPSIAQPSQEIGVSNAGVEKHAEPVPSTLPQAPNDVPAVSKAGSSDEVVPQPSAMATAFSPASIPEGGKAQTKPAASLPVTLVTVKLVPPDAKLVYRGIAVPGPPYVIEVPKGRRFAFEASRKGFVTARVTVDSIRTSVTLGLRADRAR